MNKFPTVLFQDIMKLETAIKENMSIARPTAFNKMQLDELLYFYEVYKKEFDKVTKSIKVFNEDALSKTNKTLQNYTKHERFSDKNRGL